MAKGRDHVVHGGSRVVEERPVSFAEPVQTRLAIRGGEKSVLGAAPVAHEAHLALPTVRGERLFLDPPERSLGRALDQDRQLPAEHVAEAVSRVHEVVARVQVTVVLQSQRPPAGLLEDAQSGRATRPRREGHVEELDEHLSHVAMDPLGEDLREKIPVRSARHRAFRHSGLGAPIRLDHRNELHEGRAHVVSQVPVDSHRVGGVGRVDRGEDVERNPVRLQSLDTGHHPCVRRLAAAVYPIGIVEGGGAIDADPDQEPVVAEERTPIVVQGDAVGL